MYGAGFASSNDERSISENMVLTVGMRGNCSRKLLLYSHTSYKKIFAHYLISHLSLWILVTYAGKKYVMPVAAALAKVTPVAVKLPYEKI